MSPDHWDAKVLGGSLYQRSCAEVGPKLIEIGFGELGVYFR